MNILLKPCRRCGRTERYKYGGCAPCSRARYKRNAAVYRERYEANAPRRIALTKKWKKKNSARAAAHSSKDIAVYRYGPQVIPLGFDLEATVALYEERDRLTQETGIEHCVDHVVSLAAGGFHEAANLAVRRVL